MKKIYTPRSVQLNRWYRRLSSKRLRQAIVNGGKIRIGRKKLKFSKKVKFIPVIAPYNLSLGKKNHYECVAFINKIQSSIRIAANSNNEVCICFRNTKYISAPAGIYLLSSVEEYVRRYPSVSYQVRFPPSIPDKHTRYKAPVVHAALSRIGFYSLLSVRDVKLKSFPHVDTWHVASSTIVKGNLVGEALEKLQNLGINQKALYRSGIEAMNNAIEHAYSPDIPNLNNFVTKKWWLFAGVLDNKLIFLISDKGHGIPNTIPYTQSTDLIKEIKDKLKNALLGETLVGDAEAIHIATLIKETRTALGHRGKGGPDLRKFVESQKDASLQIYSNTGTYLYSLTKKGKKPVPIGYNNKSSINGTIIGWEVPLPDEMLVKG